MTWTDTATTYVMPIGYVAARIPSHPKASASGYVYEHVLVAEGALGHALPLRAQVHHVNGDKADNRPRNLVVCEDAAYHRFLHARQRALRESGNANNRRCSFCGEHSSPAEMRFVRTRPHVAYHAECKRAYDRKRHAAIRNGNTE